MTESLLKELSTPQLLDHAVVLINTIISLSKVNKYPDLLSEKQQELIAVNNEINLRNEIIPVQKSEMIKSSPNTS